MILIQCRRGAREWPSRRPAADQSASRSGRSKWKSFRESDGRSRAEGQRLRARREEGRERREPQIRRVVFSVSLKAFTARPSSSRLSPRPSLLASSWTWTLLRDPQSELGDCILRHICPASRANSLRRPGSSLPWRSCDVYSQQNHAYQSCSGIIFPE